jgi:hypothetical protein
MVIDFNNKIMLSCLIRLIIILNVYNINVFASNNDSLICNYDYNFIDSLVIDYYNYDKRDCERNYYRSLSIILIESNISENTDKIIISDAKKIPNVIPDTFIYKNYHGAIIYCKLNNVTFPDSIFIHNNPDYKIQIESNNISIKDTLWLNNYVNTLQRNLNLYEDDFYFTYNPPVLEFTVRNKQIIAKRETYYRFSLLWKYFSKTHQLYAPIR